MTLSPDMCALIELLTEGTKKKKLNWSSNRDTDYFAVPVEGGTVELLQHSTGDGFNLLVRNDQGVLLNQTGFVSQKVSPELAELSREVRASLLQTNEAIEKIISRLRRKVTEP